MIHLMRRSSKVESTYIGSTWTYKLKANSGVETCNQANIFDFSEGLHSSILLIFKLAVSVTVQVR